jgi:signal transduction histidine kinase
MYGEPEENPIDLLKEQIADLTKEQQQILSIISHDIKAPLNRIFALVQLLEMGTDNLSQEQQQYLDKIHQVVVDGLGMIRNLVDYRNIEFRGIDIHMEDINLKEFMLRSVKNFQTLAEKKNIRLHITAPKDIIIKSDSQSLGRIADCLLSNAIKFSPEGKEVFVEVLELNNNAEIIVRDQAGGFTEEDMSKLFTKFQKLSAKTTSGETSTGLGLYLTKQILYKMEGSIKCETRAGMGSAFTVTLPLKPQ